jgi:hypothetical protein
MAKIKEGEDSPYVIRPHADGVELCRVTITDCGLTYTPDELHPIWPSEREAMDEIARRAEELDKIRPKYHCKTNERISVLATEYSTKGYRKGGHVSEAR